MARLKSIAIGPGIGSAGDATYRSVRGRTIMSARIKANESKSPEQTIQRNMFGLSTALLAKDAWWARLLFGKSKYGSRRNLFAKANFPILRSSTHFMDAVDIQIDDPSYNGMFAMLSEEMASGSRDQVNGVYLSKGAAPYLYATYHENPAGDVISEVVCSKSVLGTSTPSMSVVGASYTALLAGAPYTKVVNLLLTPMTKDQIDALVAGGEEGDDTWSKLIAAGKVPYYLGKDGLVHICVYLEAWASEYSGQPLGQLFGMFTPSDVAGGQVPSGVPYVYYPSGATLVRGLGFISLLLNGEPITLRFKA